MATVDVTQEPDTEPNREAKDALDWLDYSDAANVLESLRGAGFSLLKFGEVPHWMQMWQCEAAELNQPATYRIRPEEDPF